MKIVEFMRTDMIILMILCYRTYKPKIKSIQQNFNMMKFEEIGEGFLKRYTRNYFL